MNLDKNVDPTEIRRMINEVTFNETKQLLVDLAIHFTAQTRIVVVPLGTTKYVVEKMTEPTLISDNENNKSTNKPTITKIIIPLIRFFGMYVGFNSEVDILVLWER